MKTGIVSVAVFALMIGAFYGPTENSESQVAHMVFFELKTDTPVERKKLVDACNKYLSAHEGTIYFSAGTLADDFKREINDRKFDVSLHMVFKDRAAHDKYQTHQRHLQFIEENKANWKNVRVFDSYVDTVDQDPNR